MSPEFSVVWRWKPEHELDGPTKERRKVYKTEAGARRLLDKLLSNGGTYDKWDEDDGRYEPGFYITKWHIDYARIEVRQVGPWNPAR